MKLNSLLKIMDENQTIIISAEKRIFFGKVLEFNTSKHDLTVINVYSNQDAIKIICE